MKCYSESTMSKWWRLAVLEVCGNRCAVCGKAGQLECHHVVRRRKLLTRWDWRNGIALCVECHRKLHDGSLAVRHEVMLKVSHEHLDAMTRWISADYFTANGITMAEWYSRQMEENKHMAMGVRV